MFIFNFYQQYSYQVTIIIYDYHLIYHRYYNYSRDTLTLIDLLISPETKILTYLLRVTKYFEKINLEEFSFSLNIFIRQLSNYTKSKTNPKIAGNDNEKIKVIIYENFDTSNVYYTGIHIESNITSETNITSESNETNITRELIKNNLVLFLKDLKFELREMRKSIPFNTSVISNRIENILRNFNVTT